MIIGVIGKKGSGKDTVCDYLESKYKVKKYSFAKALKEFCMKEFRLSYDEVYDQKDKEKPLLKLNNHTPRVCLQDIGVIFRKFNPNFWVDKVITQINKDSEIFNSIADVRFPNEADICDLTIRISRPGYNGDDHESENALNNHKTDFVIINDGSLQDLHDKIEDIYCDIMEI